MIKVHLNYLVLFLAGALLFPISCQKSNVKKNIGLQLYSLRDSMRTNPVATVQEVGKMGIAFVEPAGYAEGKFYGILPAEFKTLVENNGMTVISSHTGMAVPDSTTWDSVMAWWDACIDAHLAVGAKYIVQPSMDSVAYQTLAGLQRYCDYFNAVGKKCRDKGIQFGYHNHQAELQQLEGQVIYDYMLQHTDSNLVVFEMDLYWLQEGGGNILSYFTNYPKRFPLWHVKDDKELGASGKMDFKAIFENAALSGMKYPIVEQEEYTTTPIEGVKMSFDFLNTADFVK